MRFTIRNCIESRLFEKPYNRFRKVIGVEITYLHFVLDFSQKYLYKYIIVPDISCEESQFSKINYDYLWHKKPQTVVVFLLRFVKIGGKK